jgi:hypothetical protein
MTQTHFPLRAVALPADSHLTLSLRRTDFADAYEVQLSQPELSVEQAYWAVFGSEPIWVTWLMNLRGRIAVQLGLTHPFDAPVMSQGEVPKFQVGTRVGPFTVQSVFEHELIVGDDDKHLNFRISCLMTERDGRAFVTISTAVEIHNALGQIYMFVVKPFHRFIAPYMLKRAVLRGRL